MGTIFISYRRTEGAGFAGRLFDGWNVSFGAKGYSWTLITSHGQDFVSILETRVAECDVLLALIGRGWLTATDESGLRRLDKAEDFVRIEIATALTQAKRVIPVLIDDVPMPRSEDLPEVLKPLVRCQAISLSHDRFKADSNRLIQALKQILVDAETVRREDEARREARQHERMKMAGREPSRMKAIEYLAIFRDIDAPWCPEMVALPKGEFLMGSPEEEEERYNDEGPQHRVTIKRRFAIGRYPVTFDEYDHFCAATKREKPEDMEWGRGRRPVINVSWRDAIAYCAWLADKTGQPIGCQVRRNGNTRRAPGRQRAMRSAMRSLLGMPTAIMRSARPPRWAPIR